jgi:hypothetical protein
MTSSFDHSGLQFGDLGGRGPGFELGGEPVVEDLLGGDVGVVRAGTDGDG